MNRGTAAHSFEKMHVSTKRLIVGHRLGRMQPDSDDASPSNLLPTAAASLFAEKTVRGMSSEQKFPYEMCRVRGSARDRGRAYGQWLRDRLRKFLETELGPLLDHHGVGIDERGQFAEACMPYLVDHTPRTWAFVRGLSDSTGLRVRELTLLLACEDLLWSRRHGHNAACFAISARETTDGETYLGQTWDWPWRMWTHRHLVHQTAAEGVRILTYGFPGLWSCAGMNSNGVSLVWTGGGDHASNTDARPRPGVPSSALIAEVLEQSSFDAAVQCAMQVVHAGWFVLLLAARDGRLARIEASPGAKTCERPPSMTCAHALFTAEGVRATVGQPDAGRAVGYHARYARLCELLLSHSGRMDHNVLAGFLRDHVEETATASICRHPDETKSEWAWGTLDGLLFSPSLNQSWFIPGPPCQNRVHALRYKSRGGH